MAASWACDVCTFTNEPLHLTCGICLAPRAPNTAPPAPLPGSAAAAAAVPATATITPPPRHQTPVVRSGSSGVGQTAERNRSRKRSSSGSVCTLANFLTKAKEPKTEHSSAVPAQSRIAVTCAPFRPPATPPDGPGSAFFGTHPVDRGNAAVSSAPSSAVASSRGDTRNHIDVEAGGHDVLGLESPIVADMHAWLGAIQCPAEGCGTQIGQAGYFCRHDRCGVTVCSRCASGNVCPMCHNGASFCRNLSLEKWAAAVTDVFAAEAPPGKLSPPPDDVHAHDAGRDSDGPASNPCCHAIVSDTDAVTPTSPSAAVGPPDPQAHVTKVGTNSDSGSDFFENSQPEADQDASPTPKSHLAPTDTGDGVPT
jgi:hypothetical protein